MGDVVIKVRFYVIGYNNPDQDHELPAVPRVGDGVELTAPDGQPIAFVVGDVTWTLHDVTPADVIVTLIQEEGTKHDSRT